VSIRFRILHCLCEPAGGLLRHAHDLIEGQAEMGAEIGVVCAAQTANEDVDATLNRLADHCALGITRIPIVRHMGFDDWLTQSKITKLAAKLDIDVLHGHGLWGGVYARLAGGKLKRQNLSTKVVYAPHGDGLDYSPANPLGHFLRLAERRLAPLTDGLIFESRYARQRYAETIGQPVCPVRVIPNGLYRHEFYETFLEDNAVDFAFIGELSRANGIDLFLEALAERKSMFPGKAIVVGNGPDEARARGLAKKLGLGASITFSGELSARSAFVRARCAVLPSRNDSFSYTVLEAAAARMPMIASDVGGIREIVGDVGMKLVPVDDAQALASQMRVFLAESQPFLTRAAKLQALVAERFTVDKMTQAVIDFYSASLDAGSYEKQAQEAS
jgi:glycosyltransferase involved in cell wall biosynthesis